MRRIVSLILPLIAGCSLFAAGVGSGGYPSAVQQGFLNAYNRGNFSNLVALPPPADVRSFGSAGLIQEFTSNTNANRKAALVMPDPNNPDTVFQVYPDIYAYYLVIGVTTAGYPASDTATCFSSNLGTCDSQIFAGNTALFVYSPSGAQFSVVDPIFTVWNTTSVGAPLSAVTAVTSQAHTAGNQQLFAGGAVYFYPASSQTPQVFSVAGTIYTAFIAAGGTTTLGFPKGLETVLSSGIHQQNFENGTITWTPGGSPSIAFPIGQIQLSTNYTNSVSANITLPIDSTLNASALVFDDENNPAAGRAVTWSTSNGNAVTVTSNGYTAVLKAVGAGSANITASGEGITSNTIAIRVPGQCCNVGDGAPTQTIALAFQTAAVRNQLSIAPLNSSPVSRVGSGYVQTLAAAGGTGAYVISESDNSAIAYVISGALYAAYLANGGFAGPLGFPASDASATGTQSFANGAALAGTPVRLIPPPIAAKWLASGADTGPLGPASGNASPFTSLNGSSGSVQVFAGGSIFGVTSGSHAGQAYISSGLILAAYLALNGPSGTLGIPLSDVFAGGAALQQNFETGYVDLQPGATAAVAHYYPRMPAITITPAVVAPGGTVHVTVSGFAFGANVSVSVTGQSAFSAAAPLGEFGWDIAIPRTALASIVTLKATATPDTAAGSYTIVPVNQLRPKLSIISGDQQTAAPGAALAAPLVAQLTDINGNPLRGVPVSYSTLPGALVAGPSLTDASGVITASLRLPLAEGIAGVSIATGGAVVTFNALAQSMAIAGFPTFSQTDPHSGFIAALAALIRYYQNSGSLSAPNGPAAPALLAQFLNANGGLTSSETGAPIANPWTALNFAGVAGGLSTEASSLDHIRDLLSAGSPALLEMSIQIDGSPAGGATIDAIGVNADGSISIMDPNPSFARASLTDYLNGFAAQGHNVQGTVTSALRIVPSAVQTSGFVVASQVSALASADSPSGPCVNSIDIADEAGLNPSAKTGGVRFLECDGSQPVYQIGFATNNGANILDLSGSPVQAIARGGTTAYQATRPNGALTIAPQTLAISSVVNSASLGPGFSPGGLFTVFGQGFTAGPQLSTATVGGVDANIIAEFPFQMNIQMPAALATGNSALRISGPVGSISLNIILSAAAPGIFVIGAAPDGKQYGAVVNQDGSVNTAANPAQRGQYISIYGTGLGATAPVTVNIAGSTVTPSFAGLTPGIPGLNQVNVLIPPGTAPGAEVSLSIAAGGQSSNATVFALQ